MNQSVVSAVLDMLAGQNPNAATRFTREFNIRANSAEEEIHELNCYWRNQLAQLRSSTISARSCLVDNVAPRDWLRHFDHLVLPIIVSNDLPRAAQH